MATFNLNKTFFINVIKHVLNSLKFMNKSLMKQEDLIVSLSPNLQSIPSYIIMIFIIINRHNHNYHSRCLRHHHHHSNAIFTVCSHLVISVWLSLLVGAMNYFQFQSLNLLVSFHLACMFKETEFPLVHLLHQGFHKLDSLAQILIDQHPTPHNLKYFPTAFSFKRHTTVPVIKLIFRNRRLGLGLVFDQQCTV